jgi:hypothetical protein
LLELLGGVVSLPSLQPIKFAIALDWYKTPVDGVNSNNWPNTEIGDLVSRRVIHSSYYPGVFRR